ncbi:alpha/beta hydrolase family protein [Deinococcus humi]|uniref:Alpha-beta hydrolase superfamily lysophospholipase n=1 Tax=Deinococcus humi TaxID=662880 RepID=A0A7W8NJQ3_9DEIO|nr:alpha/beta fold hydrolase [Deinococcus humi]MBB5366347.1 alpha-beta hydrolase superfamily lysophospholipase [Deinococcus humi]GGO41364.1 alpha/beta hydrolase [Deinococcus humi]
MGETETTRFNRRELLKRGGQVSVLSGLAAYVGGSQAAAMGGGGPVGSSSGAPERRGASGLKVYFDNPLFDAQLLRSLAHVYYGGADIGECLSTARRIREGNFDSWYHEWWNTAKRVQAAADASLAAGRRVSAREAYLRASNYYRTASIVLYRKPVDSRFMAAFDRQTETFRQAAALFSPAVERVAIPFEGTTLPGYFYKVDDSGQSRPTVIATGGYDGTLEELYFWNAAAALKRGYNCLSFDGPGQGAALVKQGLSMRPDWENVVRPVVDYALTRRDIDPKRIALAGLSFGGYLAPRAASGEHRLAACIADTGQYDLLAALKRALPLPQQTLDRLPDVNPAVLQPIFDRLMRDPTQAWSLRRVMWVHGLATPFDYVRATAEYNLIGRAERITCPTLVTRAENDPISAFARQLYDALKVPKEYIEFTAAEGAGEHVEDGARALYHQRTFDWLDKVLGVTADH